MRLPKRALSIFVHFHGSCTCTPIALPPCVPQRVQGHQANYICIKQHYKNNLQYALIALIYEILLASVKKRSDREFPTRV